MQDRRIRKTINAIQTAFAKLLSSKSIRKITIKELCEEADINKSTFYLHYKDIYDCADCFTDDIIEKINKVAGNYNLKELIDNLPHILEDIMAIFYEQPELYMPFLKSPYLVTSLNKIKQGMIKNTLRNTSVDNVTIDTYCVTFIIYGIMGLLEHHDFNELNYDIVSKLAHKIQDGFKCLY